MSFINKIVSLIPFGKKEEVLEYFFALNIGSEKLTSALWTIQGKKLQILQTASDEYSSLEDINKVIDGLLDSVLGDRQIEPQKILFGVPDSWLLDENLKEDYLKLLRKLVKELELTPMAYVATSHALVHFLEKQEGMPVTAILIGFESKHLEVIVSQSGKLEGAKLAARGEDSGEIIEKVLLSFSSIETLPSKILLYGQSKEILNKLKASLLSFSWMSKLSFLHFPKIELLPENIEIDSVCLAGASEINAEVSYTPVAKKHDEAKQVSISEENPSVAPVSSDAETDFGFMVGDVAKEDQKEDLDEKKNEELKTEEHNFIVPEDGNFLAETEDFEQQEEVVKPPEPITHKVGKKISISPKKLTILGLVFMVLVLLIGAYIFIPKATVKIFVESKTLEKEAQVIADPKVDKVDEEAKVIPAQIVETEVSGNAKSQATGSREIGDSAKGTVKIINNTDKGQSFSAGTILTASGLKFKLDNTASVSATAQDADSKSTVTVSATALGIGPDSNLPSGTNLTISNYATSQFVARAEGNFSGGTSKTVTVVSSDDQKKLLAQLSSDLRKKAASQLQEKSAEKKVLAEALTEQIIKKSFNKNINDQASEFSLQMNASYKGSAFDEKDLKVIVGKLVTTQVPDGFNLDLSNTQTQADVSSVEKDGKVIFLAKFKAKLIPKIDTDGIKAQIKFKTPVQVEEIVKKIDNILGSEIAFKPSLPGFLQRMPLLGKNITVEVGFK